MPSTELQQQPCPHCTALLAPGATHCHRCGENVEVAPGGVGLRPAAQSGADPASGDVDLETKYEEKSVSLAPYELDRVARAEAVDGWALLDTTVDDSRPGMILAHFRRPARPKPRPSGPPRPERRGRAARSGKRARKKKAAPRGPKGAKPARPVDSRKTTGRPEARPADPTPRRRPPAPRPAPRRRTRDYTPDEQAMRVLYYGVLAFGMLFAIRTFGFWGIFMGAWLLPGLLRNLFGIDSIERRRKKRRKERERKSRKQ